MRNVNNMTRKELEAVASKGFSETNIKFNSFVIILQRVKHESGYRIIHVVACLFNAPICKLTECSDVINIYSESEKQFKTSIINIDCLPKSGLVHVFTNFNELKTGLELSSLQITETNKQLKK